MKKDGFLMGMFGVILAFGLVLSGCGSISYKWAAGIPDSGTLTVKGYYKGAWVNEGVLTVPATYTTSFDQSSPVRRIGDDSFKDINLIRVVIPNSVTHIGAGAFSDNSITSVTIPGGVSIGPEAFDNNFAAYYNDQAGRSAGTYTYDGSTWTVD
jgi:hypothetical protein